jgi:hypothetical protein
MTIRQQGGVFGRNPSFNDVDANSVSATSISTNTISEKTSGNGVVVDGVTLKDNAVLAPFGVDVTQGRYKSAFFGNPVYMGGAGQMNFGVGGNDLILGTTNAPIRFGSTSTNAEWARITSAGLVLPNGAGIDFSATAGTGTSELFDDYEEGVFTPFVNQGFDSPISHTTQTGRYTKVGDLVYFQIYLYLDAGQTRNSDAVGIGGFPFAALAGLRFASSWNYASGVVAAGTPLPVLDGSGAVAVFYNTAGAAIIGTSLSSARPEIAINGVYKAA